MMQYDNMDFSLRQMAQPGQYGSSQIRTAGNSGTMIANKKPSYASNKTKQVQHGNTMEQMGLNPNMNQ